MLRALKLGDLLVAVPAIHAVGRGLPHHRLILAVPSWLAPIVELIDGVDRLHPTPGLNQPLGFPPGAIDTAINMHGNGPQSLHIIEALEPRVLITHDAHGGPRWVDGVLERERWVGLVEAFGMPGDPNQVELALPSVPAPHPNAAVVHVGAFYGSRQWPVERFGAVCGELHTRGYDVVVTGSASERPRAARVATHAGLSPAAVLAGRLDLAQFAAQIAAARVVISADTGAAHLASAYATPSVVIFGPAPPSVWGPPPGPHVVLTDCSARRGDPFADKPDPALLAVKPADVIAALADLPGQL